jgi:hypothetical protein
MGLLGKYTTYVGGGPSPAHALLATLFPNNPFASMLSNGDEKKAQAAVLAVATSNPGLDPNGGGIQPVGGIQAGDLGMFPTGVDLTYGAAPDTSKVKWVNPGDPANGYIPDVTSPTAGPGHIQGTDKTGDPTGTIPQIQAESTNIDPSDQDLADPSKNGPAIYKNNTLGQPQTPGSSGAPE